MGYLDMTENGIFVPQAVVRCSPAALPTRSMRSKMKLVELGIFFISFMNNLFPYRLVIIIMSYCKWGGDGTDFVKTTGSLYRSYKMSGQSPRAPTVDKSRSHFRPDSTSAGWWGEKAQLLFQDAPDKAVHKFGSLGCIGWLLNKVQHGL